MSLSLFVPEPTPSEDPIRITCPACGHTDIDDAFDVLGAEDDHVFCTQCHHEFDPDEVTTFDLGEGR